MSDASPQLPIPPWTVEATVPTDPLKDAEVGSLPSAAGVYAFEDEHGRTIALTATANVRRMVRSHIQPADGDAGSSRRIDYRPIVRTIRSLAVGSAFEADWAWLQHARRRMPHTYRAMLDRWQAWFVRCDPDAQFPQWVKTAHPDPDDGIHLGPLPDKHAAGKYMDLLVDAFDLCRYQHILVQAPHATACAYKEMGRCPAPCDGSTPMTRYRDQFRQAIAFGSTPIDHWRAEVERSMHEAGGKLDFESAQRLRALLDRTKPATRAEFALIDRLDRFRFLAVMPGETTTHARLFLILGGWIEPILDAPLHPDAAELSRLTDIVNARLRERRSDFSAAGVENIGLVCWHLFRSRRAKTIGDFVKLPETMAPEALKRSLQKVVKRSTHPDLGGPIDDRTLEIM